MDSERRETGSVQSGTRHRRLSPQGVYLVLGAGVGLLMLGHTTNHLWSRLDFWLWLGPVREFAARPLRPTHPLVALDAPDSYMGPYAFGLGIVSRLTGVDVLTVLVLTGALNLVTVLAGMWFFARRLSRGEWTPVLLLGFTLLAWGWQPWCWSGYPNLNALGTILPLGSTMAYGLGLFFLGTWREWLRHTSRRSLAAAAACFATMTLIHQPTAMWMTLIAVGLMIARPAALLRAGWDLAVAVAAVVAALLAWPFYSLVSLGSGIRDFDSGAAVTYHHVLLRTFLAVPGFVIILRPGRGRRWSPLAPALLLVAGVFAYGWISERGSLCRVLPGAMLLSHLAMADWVAARIARDGSTVASRRVLAAGVGILLAVGTLGTAPGWVRAVPRDLLPEPWVQTLRLRSYIDPNRRFAEYFRGDEVVAAESGAALSIGGYAAKVISVPAPEPFIRDARQRAEDVRVMLDPATAPRVRDRLVRKYRPDALVVNATDGPALVRTMEGATLVGDVNGFSIVRLTAP